MGLVDTLSPEDRVNVKFSDFQNLVAAMSQREMLYNGIKTEVPHKYLRMIITGKKEDEEGETT